MVVDVQDTVEPLSAAKAAAEATTDNVTDVHEAMSAASMAAYVNPAAALLAARLLLSVEECKVYGDTKSYPLALHPTQLTVDGSEAAGMVIGNLGIFLAAATLHFFACELLRLVQICVLKGFKRTQPFVHDIRGLLRFPGGSALIFQVLYQGASVGALQLAYGAETSNLRLLGYFGSLLCVAVPLGMFRSLVRCAPSKTFVILDSQTAGLRTVRRKVVRALIGNGEWISVSEQKHYALRYSAVIRPFKQNCLWYHFLQYASMFTISAIQAFSPTNYVACGHLKVASFLVIFVMLLIVLTVKPYLRTWDTVLDTLIMSFQCGALLFMAVGYYRETPQGMLIDVATILMVVSLACILVKVIMSIMCELYVLVVCRRDRLQDGYGGGTEGPFDVNTFGGSDIETNDRTEEISVQSFPMTTLAPFRPFVPSNKGTPLERGFHEEFLEPVSPPFALPGSGQSSPLLSELNVTISAFDAPPLSVPPRAPRTGSRNGFKPMRSPLRTNSGFGRGRRDSLSSATSAGLASAAAAVVARNDAENVSGDKSPAVEGMRRNRALSEIKLVGGTFIEPEKDGKEQLTRPVRARASTFSK